MPAARSRGEAKAQPRPDAYVGLLGLSFLALIVAIVFAYLNWDQIKEKPKPVQMPAGGARMPAAAAPPAPGAPAAGVVQPAPPPGSPAPGTPPGAPAPGVPGANPPQKK